MNRFGKPKQSPQIGARSEVSRGLTSILLKIPLHDVLFSPLVEENIASLFLEPFRHLHIMMNLGDERSLLLVSPVAEIIDVKGYCA